MDDRVAPALPDGRRAVVYALRRRGQATADDIARQLDMTVSGARQHLTALVADGLAEAIELPRPPGQRGRAQLAYMVTERADALFPKAYGELTNELLGYASEADSGLVEGFRGSVPMLCQADTSAEAIVSEKHLPAAAIG